MNGRNVIGIRYELNVRWKNILKIVADSKHVALNPINIAPFPRASNKNAP